MNKRIYNSKIAGVSLIEFIIAFALLAIVVLPISSLFMSAAALNQKSRNTLDYSSIARQIRSEVLEAYQTGNALYRYNFDDNTAMAKDVIPPAAMDQVVTGIGVVHLGINKLYPDIKYSLKRIPGIFLTPALNNPATADATPEIKVRADIFKLINNGALTETDATFNIVQSFYIMVPKYYNNNKRP